MRPGLFVLLAVVFLSGCSSTYPYLVTTNECNCERFVYKDALTKLEVEVSAHYVVSDRVSSEIEITFHNQSRDTLSLRQAYVKATSSNVGYQNNGRYQPAPFVTVDPLGSYSMTIEGSDMQGSENPWLKIAGEKVSLELMGLWLGTKPVAPIIVTLVPLNPKLDR